MDLGLANRVYLVTGGGRGLGRATADVLVAEGARVVMSGRTEDTLAAAVEELGDPAHRDRATYVVGDNADPDLPRRLIATARERWGRIDGALVSVGGPPTGTVTATTDEQWTTAFGSVFLGAVRVARRGRRRARGGRLDRVRALDQREGSADRDGDLQRTPARARHDRQAAGRRARAAWHPGQRAASRPDRHRAGRRAGRTPGRPGWRPRRVPRSASRSGATGSPQSSAVPRRSCSAPPRRSSRRPAPRRRWLAPRSLIPRAPAEAASSRAAVHVAARPDR